MNSKFKLPLIEIYSMLCSYLFWGGNVSWKKKNEKKKRNLLTGNCRCIMMSWCWAVKPNWLSSLWWNKARADCIFLWFYLHNSPNGQNILYGNHNQILSRQFKTQKENTSIMRTFFFFKQTHEINKTIIQTCRKSVKTWQEWSCKYCT